MEAALGELEDAECVLFSSGMAAVCAVLEPALGAGDVLVAVRDGYPGVRGVARDRLEPRGVEVRLVPTDTDAIVAACDGATLVFVETPSNPGLDVCDIAAVAEAAHAAGARLAVDGTLATPLGQRALDHGADAAVYSATKALSGHSDLVLGLVAVRDPDWAAALRAHRSQGGAIAGPFEAWLLQRSLPTLALRLARQSENALALARMLRERPDVTDVRHPGLEDHPQHALAARQMSHFGPLVCFTLESAERAQRLPRRARARRGDHQLRRRPLDGRAARALGDRRRRARASSASRPAARTPRTCSPTSSGRWNKRGPPPGGPLEIIWGVARRIRGSGEPDAPGATSLSPAALSLEGSLPVPRTG